MNIRAAQREEIATVVSLYSHYNRPPAKDLAMAALERHFDEITRSGNVAVALVDGIIVGTYSIYFCANLAHSGRPFAVIENVMVAPTIRRQGIGRALMEHAKQAALEKDCYKVMLATSADRQRNIDFYKACGFAGDKIGFQIRYGE